MQRQKGFSLISTLIVGALLMSVLIVGFKLIPVYNEFFAIKKAFAKVVANTAAEAPASSFRSSFRNFAQIDDITSVDPQTISVSKDNGKVILQTAYRREVPLFANVGLYLDFDISSQ